MNTLILVLLIFLLLVLTIAIIVFSKMFLYVVKLEQKHEELNEYVENLTDSFKQVVYEGYLKNDGRLKKTVMDKKNNPFIFNGERLSEEETLEI